MTTLLRLRRLIIKTRIAWLEVRIAFVRGQLRYWQEKKAANEHHTEQA